MKPDDQFNDHSFLMARKNTLLAKLGDTKTQAQFEQHHQEQIQQQQVQQQPVINLDQQREIEELLQKLNALSDELAFYKQENLDLKDQLGLSRQETADLQTRIESLVAENDHLRYQ